MNLGSFYYIIQYSILEKSYNHQIVGIWFSADCQKIYWMKDSNGYYIENVSRVCGGVKHGFLDSLVIVLDQIVVDKIFIGHMDIFYHLKIMKF